MIKCSYYINPERLPIYILELVAELGIGEESLAKLTAFTEPLRLKSEGTRFHYEHSQRTAILGTLTAAMLHLDPKVAYYAGMLHDIGKLLMSEELLTKESGWTEADAKAIRAHVIYGHKIIVGAFDLTAAVIVWHHFFQTRGYPKRLPQSLRGYPPALEALIPVYGMILAICDTYDAMHRASNGKFLSGDEIKYKMLDLRPEWKGIVEAMYGSDILTIKNDGLWTPPTLSKFTKSELV